MEVLFIFFAVLTDIKLVNAIDPSAGFVGSIKDYVLGLVFLLFVLFVTVYYFKRKRERQRFVRSVQKAEEVLEEAQEEDEVWKRRVVISFIRDTFFRLKEAWVHNDLNEVRDRITDHFYEKFTPQLEVFKKRGLQDFMRDIHVKFINVIEAKDYVDNDRDQISVLIGGDMINQMVNEGEMPTDNTLKYFEDVWVFKRSGNRWLVYDVFEADPFNDEFRPGSIKQRLDVFIDKLKR